MYDKEGRFKSGMGPSKFSIKAKFKIRWRRLVVLIFKETIGFLLLEFFKQYSMETPGIS